MCNTCNTLNVLALRKQTSLDLLEQTSDTVYIAKRRVAQIVTISGFQATQYLKKRLEIESLLQWTTNRK